MMIMIKALRIEISAESLIMNGILITFRMSSIVGNSSGINSALIRVT